MGHTRHATSTMSRPCTSSTTMWASRFEITDIHKCDLTVLIIGTKVFILKSSISPLSISYYISSIKYTQTASTIILAYVSTGNAGSSGRTCLVIHLFAIREKFLKRHGTFIPIMQCIAKLFSFCQCYRCSTRSSKMIH